MKYRTQGKARLGAVRARAGKPSFARAPSGWRDLLLVALAAGFLFSFALGAHELWNPNEPSYGRVVVEMVESGNWLLPQLNGEVFAEKPIFSYWLGALVSTLAGGVSEATVRVPLVLVGVLCTLLVYSLIAFYSGRSAARLGAAVFATQYLVWWTARTVQMDSFVLLSTLATTLALTRRLDGDWTARKAWIVAGLSAGIGFAAKGPVTSVVPATIIIGYCLLARRPIWKLLAGLQWGVLVFALTGLPWYVALWAHGQTEALHELLVRQNFSRFVDAWDHQQPWYYYLKYLWISYLPWSWFVPAAIWARPQAELERRGWLLGWMWILGPLVFFSLADSKREPYLLPIAPAIALLVALLLTRWNSDELPRTARLLSQGVTGLLGLLFLSAGSYLWIADLEELPSALSVPVLQATLFACAFLILGNLAWRRAPGGRAGGLLAAMVVFYLVAAAHLLPAADEIKTYKPFLRKVEAHLEPGSRLYAFFGPGNRKWQRGGGYAFYMQRTIPHLDDDAALRAAWSETGPICVITEVPLHRAEFPDLPSAEMVVNRTIGGKGARLICRRGGSGP